jgi:hypothetical protein
MSLSSGYGSSIELRATGAQIVKGFSGSEHEDPEEHHRDDRGPGPAVVPVDLVFRHLVAYVKMICPPAAFS